MSVERRSPTSSMTHAVIPAERVIATVGTPRQLVKQIDTTRKSVLMACSSIGAAIYDERHIIYPKGEVAKWTFVRLTDNF